MSDQRDSKSREEKLYEENTQRKPVRRFPKEHPDAWQWDYRGGKKERDAMAERLGLLEDEDIPVVIEGQEELPL